MNNKSHWFKLQFKVMSMDELHKELGIDQSPRANLIEMAAVSCPGCGRYWIARSADSWNCPQCGRDLTLDGRYTVNGDDAPFNTLAHGWHQVILHLEIGRWSCWEIL